MTPMIRSPDHSGAHMAARIWCRRIDSPPERRWSAWASKVTSATRSCITACSMVRDTGTSPVGRNCDPVLDPRQLADQLPPIVGEQDEPAVDRKGLEGDVEHPRAARRPPTRRR